MNDNGRIKSLSMAEAMILPNFKAALQKNPNAMANMFRLAEEADEFKDWNDPMSGMPIFMPEDSRKMICGPCMTLTSYAYPQAMHPGNNQIDCVYRSKPVLATMRCRGRSSFGPALFAFECLETLEPSSGKAEPGCRQPKVRLDPQRNGVKLDPDHTPTRFCEQFGADADVPDCRTNEA